MHALQRSDSYISYGDDDDHYKIIMTVSCLLLCYISYIILYYCMLLCYIITMIMSDFFLIVTTFYD